MPKRHVVSQAADFKGINDLIAFSRAKLTLLPAYDMSYNYEIA
jgi:hypothetical protein